MTIPTIEKEIAGGEFLEHAKVHGNYYGTSKAAVEDVQAAGRICILDIDVQGVAQVQEQGYPVGKYVFIDPPSLAQLEARLRGRGTETEERILKRIGAAKGEIDASATMHWDARVVNNCLEQAYADLKAITAEEQERAAIARGLALGASLQARE